MRIAFASIFLFFAIALQGQIYKSTLGLRLDDSRAGLSFTQRLLPKTSIQAYGDLSTNHVQAGVLVRQHVKIAGRRLNWYPMGGFHTGYFKDQGGFGGVDVGIGAEYKFMMAPIVISFDAAPSIHLAGTHPDWFTFRSIFSIHFILVKDKKFTRPKKRESDED